MRVEPISSTLFPRASSPLPTTTPGRSSTGSLRPPRPMAPLSSRKLSKSLPAANPLPAPCRTTSITFRFRQGAGRGSAAGNDLLSLREESGAIGRGGRRLPVELRPGVVVGSGDDALGNSVEEIGSTRIIGCHAKHRMVQEIVEIGSKLDAPPLADRKVLLDGKVEILAERASHTRQSARSGAELPFHGPLESCLIEVRLARVAD